MTSITNQGQVSLLGILVLLALLSSTLSAISQMHWLLLKMKARSQVYLCHARMAEETERYIHFIGSSNSALRALSLVPMTPASTANILAVKKGLQLGQKIRTLNLLQKLRANNECSVNNIFNFARESPYRNFERHPLDGTLLLEKPSWNYQLQARIGGLNLQRENDKILLRGSFKLADRFGNFSKERLYEVL